MDVVQVADQVGGRVGVAHRRFVEVALRMGMAGDPLPVQGRPELLEQRLGADDGGLHSRTCAWRRDGRALERDRAQRLPGRDQAVHLGGVVFGLEALAQVAIGEHLGDLGEDLEMPLGGRFGHQQEDQQADRLVVGRVEGDRVLHAQHRGERVLQSLDPAVRDGDAVAQAGGAEPLAGEQVVGDRGPGDGMLVLEQQPRLLEDPLLAGGVDADQHVPGRQDGSKTIHG